MTKKYYLPIEMDVKVIMHSGYNSMQMSYEVFDI